MPYSYNKDVLIEKVIEFCAVEYHNQERFISSLFKHKLIRCAAGRYVSCDFYQELTLPDNLTNSLPSSTNCLTPLTRKILLHIFVNKHLRNESVLDPQWSNTSIDSNEILNGLSSDGDKEYYFLPSVSIEKIVRN